MLESPNERGKNNSETSFTEVKERDFQSQGSAVFEPESIPDEQSHSKTSCNKCCENQFYDWFRGLIAHQVDSGSNPGPCD